MNKKTSLHTDTIFVYIVYTIYEISDHLAPPADKQTDILRFEMS